MENMRIIFQLLKFEGKILIYLYEKDGDNFIL
jgi:hypothetical protein